MPKTKKPAPRPVDKPLEAHLRRQRLKREAARKVRPL